MFRNIAQMRIDRYNESNNNNNKSKSNKSTPSLQDLPVSDPPGWDLLTGDIQLNCISFSLKNKCLQKIASFQLENGLFSFHINKNNSTLNFQLGNMNLFDIVPFNKYSFHSIPQIISHSNYIHSTSFPVPSYSSNHPSASFNPSVHTPSHSSPNTTLSTPPLPGNIIASLLPSFFFLTPARLPS